MEQINQPRLLALDLAKTRFGWAYAGPNTDWTPVSGEDRFAAGPTTGAMLEGCFDWCAARFAPNHELPVDLVICEEPIPDPFLKGKTTAETSRIKWGLPAIVETIARKRGLRFYYANVSTVRKHFIQRGNLKDQDAKRRVARRCHALGWLADDEVHQTDRADALAILAYAMHRLLPEIAKETTPLFAGDPAA